MISALRVSCGTRLAPRNSNPSIVCPAEGATVSACLGASSCGCCAGGVPGAGWGCGASAGFACSVGMVSKGFFFCWGGGGCAGACCAGFGGCCPGGCGCCPGGAA